MSPVLSVRDLKVSFASESGRVDAVRGVSFDLEAGKTLGIVGESGSGKSVTSLAVMGLLDENAKVTGSIVFDGQELLGKTDTQLSAIRGNGISMVFQDPLTSLTPVYTIGAQLIEALTVHRNLSVKEATTRSIELLKLVGITEPEKRMKSFPHEFSGGMRQRVVIAIAMANNPKLIIADEPTTALDVTIQAQITELLKTIQQKTDLAIIFITHNLGVVAEVADKVLVMYAGSPVEMAGVDDLFQRPQMPYTRGLLNSVPRISFSADRRKALPSIPGNVPDPRNLPPGCSFGPRCGQFVGGTCDTSPPRLLATGHRHAVRCHRAGEFQNGYHT